MAAALWTDAELESSVCLDAVVAVVDAKNIRRQLADRPGEAGGRDGGGGEAKPAQGGEGVNEAAQQVAFADVVLLNKVGGPAGRPTPCSAFCMRDNVP